MERKFYTDDFEQLLKEKSDEFRMYPSKRVWHSIYNDLHPGRKWPSVAASMLLIIALLFVGYWNNSSPKTLDTSVATLQKNKLILSSATKLKNSLAIEEKQKNTQSIVTNNIIASAQSKDKLNKTTLSSNNSGHYNAVGTNNYRSSFNPKNDYTKTINKLLQKSIDNSSSNTGINLKETPAAVTNLAFKNNDEEKQIINSPDYLPEPVSIESNNTIVTSNSITEKVSTINNIEDKASKLNLVTAKNKISAEDKAWIEDYALHNRPQHKKWKDRSTLEFYITPSIGYRKLSNDSKYNVPASASSSSLISPSVGVDAAKSVNQKPGLGVEAGVNINYAIAKNLRFKAGIQANYTNYGINADETNHPILTTLMFIDPNSGYPYMHSSVSTLSNTSGLQPVLIHNKTYQVSIPLGFALKLSGNNKLEWYAGATIQPTYAVGGKAYLISADRKNYVADPSLIRKWNLNTGFETYINYKFDGFTLQAGPQFRYQLLSTYYKRYTVNENLYNIGLKVGVVKNF
jgi:hypothetical protein